MQLHVKSLSLNGVLRASVPVKLRSVPQVSCLPLLIAVPRLELVDRVSFENYLRGKSEPRYLCVFKIRVNLVELILVC